MNEDKKYRFYYSRKQDRIDEDMWGFNPKFTYVKTPNGYKQYSELCSLKGSKCNWGDAVLVYECDDEPEIIVHENIPELIGKLQEQLKNAIVPKFKVGQIVFAYAKKLHSFYVARIYIGKSHKIHYELRPVDLGAYCDKCENEIWETQAEAEQKLKELGDK